MNLQLQVATSWVDPLLYCNQPQLCMTPHVLGHPQRHPQMPCAEMQPRIPPCPGWRPTLRKGMTKGRSGKLVASWSLAWNSSMVRVEFCGDSLASAPLAQPPHTPGAHLAVPAPFLLLCQAHREATLEGKPCSRLHWPCQQPGPTLHWLCRSQETLGKQPPFLQGLDQSRPLFPFQQHLHPQKKTQDPLRCGVPWLSPGRTTSPRTRVRTRSPISGEMSFPNCCRVVRKRFSLESWRAPQAGGSWWVDREALEDVAGPLLNPLGVDGAPLMAVGEWLLPFITGETRNGGQSGWLCHGTVGIRLGWKDQSVLLGNVGLASPGGIQDAGESLELHPGLVGGEGGDAEHPPAW